MTTTLPSWALCGVCGIPRDSKYFDASGAADPPEEVGDDVVLARFDLQPQYCGRLEYFSQFTDEWGSDPSKIETPGLEWTLRSDGQPLFPYLGLHMIVNPWGYGSFPVAIRLEEGATIELAVRRVADPGFVPGAITRVGGRFVGRYWYNEIYADVDRNGI